MIAPIRKGEFDQDRFSLEETRKAEDFRRDQQVRRDLVDPTHVTGLNLTWANTSTVEISTGSFGTSGNLFELLDATSVGPSDSTVSRWDYVFLAANEDDPRTVRAFASKDSTGGGLPIGFSIFKRIGMFYVDASGNIESFVQGGTGSVKEYSLWTSSIVIVSPLTNAAALYTCVPDGAVRGQFFFVSVHTGDMAHVLFANPDITQAGTPAAFTFNDYVAANPVTQIDSTFEFAFQKDGSRRLWLWMNVVPATAAFVTLKGWTDDIG
jgi:hypothetical protein